MLFLQLDVLISFDLCTNQQVPTLPFGPQGSFSSGALIPANLIFLLSNSDGIPIDHVTSPSNHFWFNSGTELIPNSFGYYSLHKRCSQPYGLLLFLSL